MAARREIIPGRVYEQKRNFRHKFRRVIGVHSNIVVYNCGGDRNFSCCLAAFKRATKRDPVASCAGSCQDSSDLLQQP